MDGWRNCEQLFLKQSEELVKLWQFIYTQLLSVYLCIIHLSHITYRERSYYLLVFMYLCLTQQHQRILLKSSKTYFNSSKLTVASQTFHLLGKYLCPFSWIPLSRSKKNTPVQISYHQIVKTILLVCSFDPFLLSFWCTSYLKFYQGSQKGIIED